MLRFKYLRKIPMMRLRSLQRSLVKEENVLWRRREIWSCSSGGLDDVVINSMSLTVAVAPYSSTSEDAKGTAVSPCSPPMISEKPACLINLELDLPYRGTQWLPKSAFWEKIGLFWQHVLVPARASLLGLWEAVDQSLGSRTWEIVPVHDLILIRGLRETMNDMQVGTSFARHSLQLNISYS